MSLNKISAFILMKHLKVEDKIKEWNLAQGGKRKYSKTYLKKI